MMVGDMIRIQAKARQGRCQHIEDSQAACLVAANDASQRDAPHFEAAHSNCSKTECKVPT